LNLAPGEYQVYAKKDGYQQSATQPVTVVSYSLLRDPVPVELTLPPLPNVAPVVTALSNAALNTGGTFSQAGTFTDSNTDDTWTATVNYGEGGTVPLTLTGQTFSLSHVYASNGVFTVTVEVTDKSGAKGSGTATVTVTAANTKPVINEILVPTDPVRIPQTITVTATVTDVGNRDPLTAVWKWDDPSLPVQTQTINTDPTTGKVTFSIQHPINSPDVYKVNLTVTDSGGLSDYKAAPIYIAGYDPSAGYVIGAGTIVSPVGAYLPQPTWGGTGYFGFVSKYKKGISRPQGVTEFYYDAGNMNFFSDNYDVLVVAGNKAWYKGSGRINGQGDYGFLLAATDGALAPKGSDKFRIRIWSKNPVKRVYDTMMDLPDDADPTTPLKWGFIVIQK
jgi:hypothetical protein